MVSQLTGRQVVLVADDLDFVARAQLGHQRHDGAVDLGADAGVADVGVQRIGEVDRRRAARQRDQPAARGEAEHLVLEQLELGVFEEILGRDAPAVRCSMVGAASRRPCDLVLDAGEIAGGALLVERVRGDAEFGDAVHFLGADLQFGALPPDPDDGGVDRVVVVVLGDRDVVLEAAGHDLPVGVDDAERAVAFGDRRRR